MIIDNLRVDHAMVVREWPDETAERIEVFYLPLYRPEPNPDECLNAYLKQAVTTKLPLRDTGQMREATVSHFRKLS